MIAHLVGNSPAGTLCGHNKSVATTKWADVTCGNCLRKKSASMRPSRHELQLSAVAAVYAFRKHHPFRFPTMRDISRVSGVSYSMLFGICRDGLLRPISDSRLRMTGHGKAFIEHALGLKK